MSKWQGGFQLATRGAKALAQIGIDALAEQGGIGLPRTPEQLADREVVNALLREHALDGGPGLPSVRGVRLPGRFFESSNCTNFLLELDFDLPLDGRSAGPDGDPLPRTIYAKLPCPSIATRTFAQALGFWSLECFFCERIAGRVPIRVPRVHAVARRGSRFVLLLENLEEIPGVRLFLNRDMALGTTPERAERVLKTFARLHASFWGWSKEAQEALLPLALDPVRGPRSSAMTHALDAAALAPAHRAAPDIVSTRIVETCRRAFERWDGLLEAWSRGPLALVHGDSHLGNCFEYPSASGPEVGMLDFQAVHWSHGVRDVQYFLINSLEPEVLAAHEEALLRGYCDELARHGVSLSLEEAWDRARAFSFQTLLAGLVPLGLGALTERNRTVLAVTRRSAAAVERWAFRDWLEALD